MKTTLWATLAFIAGMIFVAGAGSSLAGDDESPAQAAEDARVQGIIAEAFGVSPELVADLKEQGIGYGAAVKLLAIAEAKGVSVSELVASLPVVDGEVEPGIGELLAGLSEDELEALRSSPTSLGPLIAEKMRPSFAGGDGDETSEAQNENEVENQDNGEGGEETGHEACSAATAEALDRLTELSEAGEPVDDAIAAIEQCGTGTFDPSSDDEAGPPEGAGVPDWVPGPPPGVEPGPPDDVPGGEEIDTEGDIQTQQEDGEDAGPPEEANAPDWVPGPPPGVPAGGEEGEDGEDAGPPEGAGPPDWVPGPPPGVPGGEEDGETGDEAGPPEGAGPPDWVPGPPPGVPGVGDGSDE